MRWLDPRDLVAATRDKSAIRRPRIERARHLNADDYDGEGRGWKQVPDSPLGAILVVASRVAIIVAAVILL
jgi:hypothetical protein